MPQRAVFERSRRELSLDVSVDVHILLVVEQSSLESQSRGCAKTPILTNGIPPEFHGGVHLFIYSHHTPPGHFRVYRVTQLRTDGVHCRESAGTGPVNLKVVPVTGAALAGHHGPLNMPLFPFPTPTIGMKRAC